MSTDNPYLLDREDEAWRLERKVRTKLFIQVKFKAILREPSRQCLQFRKSDLEERCVLTASPHASIQILLETTITRYMILTLLYIKNRCPLVW